MKLLLGNFSSDGWLHQRRHHEPPDRFDRHADYINQELPTIDLITAALAIQTPHTEVLAIVGEQLVSVLAESRVGAANRFGALEPGVRALPDPDGVPMCKLSERDLLHWASMQRPRQSCVMHYPPVSRINTVMRIAKSLGNEMATDGHAHFRDWFANLAS